MAFDLRGRTALVTGAGRGIGAAIVTRLAEAGARVVAANRTTDHAIALAAKLTSRGLSVSAAAFSDISRKGITHLVEEAARPDGLDIVVHNAGGCPWVALSDLTEDTLMATLNLNLSACFWLAQASTPHMQAKGGGRFLVTSSVTGPRVAMVRAAPYAAAKAGVNGFLRAAALELARFNITVNGVEPGFIAKPDRGLFSTPELREKIGKHIPLGRSGDVDDVAFAMLYLASDEAKYITGQTIVVDGGALLPETGYALEVARAMG